MIIKDNYFLHTPTFTTKNSDESELLPESKQHEFQINKIFEIFYTSIDFLPLVNFINEENAEFEALLLNDEQRNTHNSNLNDKSLIFSQKKNRYNLRYKPHRLFQKQSNSSSNSKIEKEHSYSLKRLNPTIFTLKKRTNKHSRAIQKKSI